jgi:hypothetical protein
VLVSPKAQSRNDGTPPKGTDMDWEEALLRCCGAEKTVAGTATHFRQKAVRAREMAEEARTRP